MNQQKRIKQVLLLPLLLGLVLSCQDEMTDAWKGKDKEWNATIERAKVIFSEYSPDFPCIQTRGLSEIRKSIVFEPVWDEAFIAYHDDGSLTVEAHIRLSKPLAVVSSESFEAYQSTKDVRYLQYLSRAVVLIKENSIPQAFLMTIVGSKDYMEAHDFQLWDVCYKNIPEDFSGMLLYHTLSGEFVNGWHVEEGHRYSTCNPVSEEDAELFSRSGTDCYIEQVTTYYVDCQDYAGYNYTFYEDELYIYPWSYSSCGTPYPVIEYYQVCDDDTEDDSGSSGGGITGGGGSSSSGGGSAPLAKAMFRNSNMTNENWEVIENMLKKITKDCMGQNLYNALLEKLDGKQLVIQFWNKEYSSFDHDDGEGIKISTQYVYSNHLFHEMWHAYQAYYETVNSYENALINLEIESHYAQYLYVKSLPEYAGSRWEEKYSRKRHKLIKKIQNYVDEYGELIVLENIDNESLMDAHMITLMTAFKNDSAYSSCKYDSTRIGLSNFTNLQTITKNCKQ